MTLEELQGLLGETGIPAGRIHTYCERLQQAEATLQVIARLDRSELAASQLAATLAGGEVVTQAHRIHASAIIHTAVEQQAAVDLLLPLATLSLNHYVRRSEGLKSRPFSTQRAVLVDQVLQLACAEGFCMLKAPPRSGKTSLLELCQARALRVGRFQRALYFSCAFVNPNETFAEAFEKQTGVDWLSVTGGGSGSKYIILVDEIQTSFKSLQDEDGVFLPLWNAIKFIQRDPSTASLCIVAAALYGDAPSGSSASSSPIASPADLAPELCIGLHPSDVNPLAMVLTLPEFEELWSSCVAYAPQGTIRDACIKDYVWSVTAGHVGMISYLLDSVMARLKSGRSLPEPGSGDKFLWNFFRTGAVYVDISTGGVMGSLRSFMSLDKTSDDTKWQVINKLLVAHAQGRTSLELHEFDSLCDAVQRLQAKGYIYVLSKKVSFITPLHCHYYLAYHLSHRLRRVPAPTLPADADQRFQRFLQRCISRMRHSVLFCSLGVGSSGTLLERALQMEFYCAAVSVLPASCTVSPDVGSVFGSMGLVNFWISPYNWAIELVRDGSKMAEHERRFTDGLYAQMPFEKHAVIDFRSPGSTEPRPQVYPDSYQVLFDAEFRVAAIVNGQDTAVVPLAA